MAVPQYALTLCTMLGDLAEWYGFAEKSRGNWSLRRNGHSRSLLYSGFEVWYNSFEKLESVKGDIKNGQKDRRVLPGGEGL